MFLVGHANEQCEDEYAKGYGREAGEKQQRHYSTKHSSRLEIPFTRECREAADILNVHAQEERAAA